MALLWCNGLFKRWLLLGRLQVIWGHTLEGIVWRHSPLLSLAVKWAAVPVFSFSWWYTALAQLPKQQSQTIIGKNLWNEKPPSNISLRSLMPQKLLTEQKSNNLGWVSLWMFPWIPLISNIWWLQSWKHVYYVQYPKSVSTSKEKLEEEEWDRRYLEMDVKQFLPFSPLPCIF